MRKWGGLRAVRAGILGWGWRDFGMDSGFSGLDGVRFGAC